MGAVEPGKKYLLEFWALANSGSYLAKYSLYDTVNDAYLTGTGWQYANASGQPPNGTMFTPARNVSLPSGTYEHVVKGFSTLPRAKLQLRFYPNGVTYLDDVSVSEANDFSMLAWVRADAVQAGGDLFRQQNGSQGMVWRVNSSNALTITMQSNGTQLPGTATTLSRTVSLADGKWHQVGLSVDRLGNYSVYDNGALANNSSAPFTLGALNASGNLTIGGDSQGGFFKGEIGEVRFYKRALTLSDMADHYAGRFQQQCKIDLSVKYTTTDASSLSAAYNADLRIRKLLPDTILSMPFDVNVSSEETGMVVDYSRFLGAGTKKGAAWTPSGKIGGAYEFNMGGRVNDSIVLPSSLINGTGDFTVMAWIYPQGISGTSCVLCSYSAANPSGMIFGLSGGYPMVGIGLSQSVVSSDLLNLTWVHLAAVRKAGTGTLYLNGVALISGQLTSSIASSAPLTIGNGAGGTGANLFTGRIDEVRVFSRALTAEEIASQYNDNGLVSSVRLPISQK
jgi:hypothetical protein